MTLATDFVDAIPLTRLDNDDPELLTELLATVEAVARKAAFTGGAEVEAFEEEWAAYCGTAHAVGVSSGTEALALALRALDIGPGDEVVVPANSFIATAEAVTLVGATPRFVDVDPVTALVTADHIAPAITPCTRAVMPVHLYGRTVDMAPIMRLARSAGIAVVEDACQAHGAHVDGRRAGAVGDAGAFSFYPAKNLGAWGDGGALVTDDDAIADRVRLLRSHGERPRYHHRMPGTTARLDALQAAILRVKLRRLEAWNDGRRRAGAALTAALAGAPVRVPAPARADHVFHQYVIGALDRDALRAHLERWGIATGVHYPVPIHRTDAYRELYPGVGSLPVAEALAESSCSLPMHPSLGEAEITRIAEAVHSFGGS
ncbi:MAG TPA: DegT/DnrJ/EryC1/StrS family aminotransferase [Baekduia sp.]|nr:DegT/DnrJ/EryC1/StrS family aminotransferase [Baekduia sp.]